MIPANFQQADPITLPTGNNSAVHCVHSARKRHYYKALLYVTGMAIIINTRWLLALPVVHSCSNMLVLNMFQTELR